MCNKCSGLEYGKRDINIIDEYTEVYVSFEEDWNSKILVKCS